MTDHIKYVNVLQAQDAYGLYGLDENNSLNTNYV